MESVNPCFYEKMYGWLRLTGQCYALSCKSDAVGEYSQIKNQTLVQKDSWKNEDLPFLCLHKIQHKIQIL